MLGVERTALQSTLPIHSLVLLCLRTNSLQAFLCWCGRRPLRDLRWALGVGGAEILCSWGSSFHSLGTAPRTLCLLHRAAALSAVVSNPGSAAAGITPHSPELAHSWLLIFLGAASY